MRKRIKRGVYDQMQRFAEITLKLIQNGKTERANRCLAIVDKLFATGNVQMQNAITVVYLYYLGAILDCHHFKVTTLLPEHLKKEYIRINSFAL